MKYKNHVLVEISDQLSAINNISAFQTNLMKRLEGIDNFKAEQHVPIESGEATSHCSN